MNSLKDMATFMLSDEVRIILNQEHAGLYVDVDTQKHSSDVKTAIDDVLVNK